MGPPCGNHACRDGRAAISRISSTLRWHDDKRRRFSEATYGASSARGIRAGSHVRRVPDRAVRRVSDHVACWCVYFACHARAVYDSCRSSTYRAEYSRKEGGNAIALGPPVRQAPPQMQGPKAATGLPFEGRSCYDADYAAPGGAEVIYPGGSTARTPALSTTPTTPPGIPVGAGRTPHARCSECAHSFRRDDYVGGRFPGMDDSEERGSRPRGDHHWRSSRAISRSERGIHAVRCMAVTGARAVRPFRAGAVRLS